MPKTMKPYLKVPREQKK